MLAIGFLTGCLKGGSPEEREAGRKGRIECSDPEIIPGPPGASDLTAPDPPC